MLGVLADAATETGSSYRVFVRNLVVPCRIGIYEHERRGAQQVRVNVLVVVDRSPGTHISTVLNYESIVSAVRAVAESGHIELVEVFAARVLEECLRDGRVSSARIAVEKLAPWPEAESAGVILEQQRRGASHRT